MLSGPTSVPADRSDTAVLKATTAAYFRAGCDPLFTISPCLLENILLCSPRAGAEGLLDLPKHQWGWMILSTWDTGDRGGVGITTAD